MEITYIIHTDEAGRPRAGWRATLDGQEYGNDLILEHEDQILSDDLKRILVFNAGESMATVVLGEPEYPPDNPTDTELLKFLTMQSARAFFRGKAQYHLDTDGFVVRS